MLKPASFVKYKGKIGLVLYTPEHYLKVNYFNGRDTHSINRSKLGSPSMEELERVLLENEELRHLAQENELIEIEYQERLEFLKYAGSYN
tara:strand:- start:1864 stop:2133 length:270 start_codon:yes stop_codon:yes gene_type:complete